MTRTPTPHTHMHISHIHKHALPHWRTASHSGTPPLTLGHTLPHWGIPFLTGAHTPHLGTPSHTGAQPLTVGHTLSHWGTPSHTGAYPSSLGTPSTTLNRLPTHIPILTLYSTASPPKCGPTFLANSKRVVLMNMCL